MPASTIFTTERRAIVDRARQSWIERLVDLSRRNNLLFFRHLKRGTLDLANADREALDDLFGDTAVGPERLLPDADPDRLPAQVLDIARRAQANRDERNLETLYIACGLATWKSEDGGRPAEAPIVLLPVGVEKRPQGARVMLRRTGVAKINPVLLHVLNAVHRCGVDEDTLLSAAEREDEQSRLDFNAVFEHLVRAAAAVPEFAVTRSIVLGNFSFHKLAMVRDLEECGGVMADHELISALAGDTEARAGLGERGGLGDPRELDEMHPDDEFLILDADSSQQRVVAAALADRDGVIQGPPGTGKSQTIANVIAALAARGKRVLFVAQKRAALEVVLRRLENVGLGHLALDLHGAELSRRQVMAKFAESLDHVREAVAVDSDALHGRLAQCRAKLNDHVARLHAARAPSGLSAYEIQGRLLRMHDVTTRTRWRGPDLQRLDAERAGRARTVLEEACELADLLLGTSTSPWNNVELSNGQAALDALDLVVRLANERIPAFLDRIDRVSRETGLRRAVTIDQAEAIIKLVEDVNSTLSRFHPELFQADLDALATSLQPARSRISALWAGLTRSAYRDARKKVLTHRIAGKVSTAQLLAEVEEARDEVRRWRDLGGQAAAPRGYGVTELREATQRLASELDQLAKILSRADLPRLTIDQIRVVVDALAGDSATPAKLPRVFALRHELNTLGLQGLLQELKLSPATPSAWIERFDHALLSSCLDQVRAEDPALASFNGRSHDTTADEFRRLDRERLAITAARVRRAHAERVIDAMNRHPAQAQLVRNEAYKKSRHQPLRKTVTQAPDVITALRPCWMVSPLSVAELLPAAPHFDLVLFDEASQVLPEDAVCALMRGRKAIVAGDQHQLPPTAFFAGGSDDDGTDDDAQGLGTAGFESILGSMCTFVEPWSLDWHYRSRDESLIAFSNRYIYGDRLITFPGVGDAAGVSHVLVEPSAARDGEEDSVTDEVRRVVDLVVDHARRRPNESLGVITMGIKHQDRILAALDSAMNADPDLASFLDEQRDERFFVKNLERVQGDERDAIILSVGYGKDRNGKLPYRFGPLLQDGGERRLNVAVTRARRRMTLVSSFSHLDMDPGRSSAKGVELLRRYLEFAASGGHSLGDRGVSGGVSMNPFEAAVFDALSAKGIQLEAQWGVSRYRIDLVAKHPSQPGRMVLAIECDGASYHSAPTARDRDRLRQQQLEALGWRFHRIWSTDWFLGREDEIERAMRAYERAVEMCEREPDHVPRPEVGLVRAVTQEPMMRRPAIPRRQSIDEYSEEELEALVHWVQSGGNLLTDDEIVRQVMIELGFRRSGARIDAAIRRGIDRARGPLQ